MDAIKVVVGFSVRAEGPPGALHVDESMHERRFGGVERSALSVALERSRVGSCDENAYTDDSGDYDHYSNCGSEYGGSAAESSQTSESADDDAHASYSQPIAIPYQNKAWAAARIYLHHHAAMQQQRYYQPEQAVPTAQPHMRYYAKAQHAQVRCLACKWAQTPAMYRHAIACF